MSLGNKSLAIIHELLCLTYVNAAFRQIGNAVPPLMAKAIADEILKTLKQIAHAKEASYQETDSF